jgi:hypothetical protein
VVPGDIRVIEYQVLPWAELDRLGDVQQHVKEAMGVAPDVGILRCVTKDGRKVTFVGDANSTNDLVASGAASNPQGFAIAKRDFPLLEEWPFRIRDD